MGRVGGKARNRNHARSDELWEFSAKEIKTETPLKSSTKKHPLFLVLIERNFGVYTRGHQRSLQ